MAIARTLIHTMSIQYKHVAINDSGLRQNEYSVMKVNLHSRNCCPVSQSLKWKIVRVLLSCLA